MAGVRTYRSFLQGGFDWYIGTRESRLDLIRNGPPQLPKIETPTRVRWGESDPILKVEWADLLGDYFSDCDFARFEAPATSPTTSGPTSPTVRSWISSVRG